MNASARRDEQRDHDATLRGRAEAALDHDARARPRGSPLTSTVVARTSTSRATASSAVGGVGHLGTTVDAGGTRVRGDRGPAIRADGDQRRRRRAAAASSPTRGVLARLCVAELAHLAEHRDARGRRADACERASAAAIDDGLAL